MRITAMTVCVDYADLLARSINRWRDGCDELLVITAPRDHATLALCAAAGVRSYATEVFWAHGAAFNKGAAISEAYELLGPRDWVLSFDSDIVPPADWRQQLERRGLVRGNLYGAYRWELPEDAASLSIPPGQLRMPQSWVIGFFSLFHATDQNVRRPLFDIDWPHAGNYDTIFTRRWARNRQTMLDLRMIHLGEERRNWFGRHNRPAMDAAMRRRREEGYRGHWSKERMPAAPRLAQHNGDPQ